MIKAIGTDEQDRPSVFASALCGHLSGHLAMFLSD